MQSISFIGICGIRVLIDLCLPDLIYVVPEDLHLCISLSCLLDVIAVNIKGLAICLDERLYSTVAIWGEWACRLENEAKELATKVRKQFYDQIGWAMALDGENKAIDSISSNPGHLLLSGILNDSEARELGERLLRDDMFSGYGIRTMSSICAGYNPLSYHNGSIWPHDNALIAWGFSRTGQREEANLIFASLLRASEFFPQQRLPELYAGFEGSQIVPYPVACSPQAWAAGTPFLLTRAVLGLEPDLPRDILYVNPLLPEGVPDLTVEGLRLGEATVSLAFVREGDQTRIRILELIGNLKVIHAGTGEEILRS